MSTLPFIVDAFWNHQRQPLPAELATLETSVRVNLARLAGGEPIEPPAEPCPWFSETVAIDVEDGIDPPMNWAEALALTLDHANQQRGVVSNHHSAASRYANREAGVRALAEAKSKAEHRNAWSWLSWLSFGL